MDKNLFFNNHLSSLAYRSRKSICITKALRQSAGTDILIMVHKVSDAMAVALLHNYLGKVLPKRI